MDVKELAKVEINGRQIKNAVELASTFAQDEDVTMNAEHLKTTLHVTTSFLSDTGVV